MITTDGDESGFYIRSDGTFHAFAGDVILKAETRGASKAYPFEATASTPEKDRDGEVVLQKGLNFEPFREHGDFNWNHNPHIIVGVPVGKKAWFDEVWKCQGEIVSGMPILGEYNTDHIVQQHNALKKAGMNRGLCCSIEGKVNQRSSCGRYIEKADIYAVALTFRPVNPNCTVAMLQKSMMKGARILERDEYYKAQERVSVTEEIQQGSGEGLATKLMRHLVIKGYTIPQAQLLVGQYLAQKFPALRKARHGMNPNEEANHGKSQ